MLSEKITDYVTDGYVAAKYVESLSNPTFQYVVERSNGVVEVSKSFTLSQIGSEDFTRDWDNDLVTYGKHIALRQWIGVTDRKGTKVFTGDIICLYAVGGLKLHYKIDGLQEFTRLLEMSPRFEVVGNVYELMGEDGELLEKIARSIGGA